MKPRAFGSLPSGEAIELYTLKNSAGASLEVITYGAIVTALRVPDRLGRIGDIVLGFGTLNPYIVNSAYVGAIVGRIAGRVTAGRLVVQDRRYRLACNEGPNHLHGGCVGLDQRIWSATPLPSADGGSSLRLSYRSADGEEGYPGTIDIALTYTLTAANAFIVETEATSDRATPLSLAQHSYFNLAGENSGSVADHEIQIFADGFVPVVDAAMTLADRREPLTGRPNDFTRPRRLREALPRFSHVTGDLYHLRKPNEAPPRSPALAARITEPCSGRGLDVLTNESCLQFYTGALLDGTLIGKSGQPYGPHAGLCLECQGYPNGGGIPTFGDILVYPGQLYRRITSYVFSIR